MKSVSTAGAAWRCSADCVLSAPFSLCAKAGQVSDKPTLRAQRGRRCSSDKRTQPGPLHQSRRFWLANCLFIGALRKSRGCSPQPRRLLARVMSACPKRRACLTSFDCCSETGPDCVHEFSHARYPLAPHHPLAAVGPHHLTSRARQKRFPPSAPAFSTTRQGGITMADWTVSHAPSDAVTLRIVAARVRLSCTPRISGFTVVFLSPYSERACLFSPMRKSDCPFRQTQERPLGSRMA
ncbi:uncharacterized protein J3D65DRAFT_339798 [Phyllosticta citribraziliensis]|uniref:Uncharacterized protein n=1 Tax=Phyllosticta citribraziliensis TaxID=989973 RepID=A0ABR1LU15_9PEZI